MNEHLIGRLNLPQVMATMAFLPTGLLAALFAQVILPRICGGGEAARILLAKEGKDHDKGSKDVERPVQARSAAMGADQWQTNRPPSARTRHF
jgi:hypothetical protein